MVRGFPRARVQGCIFGQFSRFKGRGLGHGIVFDMIRKEGSAITASFSGRVSFDQRGESGIRTAFSRNITEQRKAEEERGQLSAMIDKSLTRSIYLTRRR